MPVGLDILGKSFDANQFSGGTFAIDTPDMVTFTQGKTGAEFGVVKLTITGMTAHSDGTTSVVVTALRSDGTSREGAVSVIANGSGDFVLYDPSGKGADADAIYICNDPTRQPGDGNSLKVPAESANIVYQPLCFVSDTRIRTARGDVAVEHLRVGDLAITGSGARRRIRWLGHRVIERPAEEGYPVRVVAGAFGADSPARNLWLSPGHPVLVGADENGEGGHLVPIMCLINGTTIERVAVDSVTYWHIELDEHDILVAEGLPAESYIDLGSRPWFDGANRVLYDPDIALPHMPGRCRPVAIDGPIVEAERRRLDALLATRIASAAKWPDVQNSLLALF